MIQSLIDQQTKKLVAHMNDYQQAAQLQQKGEAAIFDRHRLPGGKFAEGLKEDLAKYRKDFAEEWGAEGWRNQQFVKQQIEEARRPSDEEMEEMRNLVHAADQEPGEQREEFLNKLHKAPRQQASQGPKPR